VKPSRHKTRQRTHYGMLKGRCMKNLKKCVLFFNIMMWLLVAYPVIVITLNWVNYNPKPETADIEFKMGMISSLVVLLQGALGAGIFMCAAQITKAIRRIEKAVTKEVL
ncbi:MAG: hypothetical protein NTW04_00865, partial [Elusimicrobia bacterium]|nr:hypothetical protein [Elusimicrobiota bacterium]